MVVGIGAEDHLQVEELFHAHEEFGVHAAEALEYAVVHGQAELTLLSGFAPPDSASVGFCHEGVPDGDGGFVGEPEGDAGFLRGDSGCDQLLVVEVEDDAGALGGGAVETRQHGGEEGQREVVGVGGFVAAVGLDGHAPARAEFTVVGVDFQDDGAAGGVFAAGDEEARDVARGGGGRRDIDAALVGDKRGDARGAEAGEAVAELSAGGKPEEKQGRGVELGMAAGSSESGKRAEQRAAAAAVGFAVGGEHGKIVGREIAGNEGEGVVAREGLPLRAAGEVAAIDVDAVEHDGDAADRAGAIGQPEVEGGFVEAVVLRVGNLDVEGGGPGEGCERGEAEEQREQAAGQRGHGGDVGVGRGG